MKRVQKHWRKNTMLKFITLDVLLDAFLGRKKLQKNL
jgi:hypothetical protein